MKNFNLHKIINEIMKFVLIAGGLLALLLLGAGPHMKETPYYELLSLSAGLIASGLAYVIYSDDKKGARK